MVSLSHATMQILTRIAFSVHASRLPGVKSQDSRLEDCPQESRVKTRAHNSARNRLAGYPYRYQWDHYGIGVLTIPRRWQRVNHKISVELPLITPPTTLFITIAWAESVTNWPLHCAKRPLPNFAPNLHLPSSNFHRLSACDLNKTASGVSHWIRFHVG